MDRKIRLNAEEEGYAENLLRYFRTLAEFGAQASISQAAAVEGIPVSMARKLVKFLVQTGKCAEGRPARYAGGRSGSTGQQYKAVV